MFTKSKTRYVSHLLITLVVTSLPVPACSPAAPPTTLPDPTATVAPPPTSEPTGILGEEGVPRFSLDTGSLATGFQTETVAAVPPNANSPYWEVLPEHTRVILEGYPIENHLLQPQIFVYPVEELAQFNEGAGTIVDSLRTLLQSPQEIENMPFLPLFNAQEMLHAQLQYLDFKSGQGLRYLTEFSQGILPINNSELFYTYQGMTNDGKYYVSAVLPVTHPSLPADGNVTGNEPPEFTSDFPTYLTNVVASLNPKPASTFTPDLTQLDVMMNSLEIE